MEGLIAKPIVDILMEVTDDCNIVELKSTLESSGWICMSESYMPELKLVFNKGVYPNGFANQVYPPSHTLFPETGTNFISGII